MSNPSNQFTAVLHAQDTASGTLAAEGSGTMPNSPTHSILSFAPETHTKQPSCKKNKSSKPFSDSRIAKKRHRRVYTTANTDNIDAVSIISSSDMAAHTTLASPTLSTSSCVSSFQQKDQEPGVVQQYDDENSGPTTPDLWEALCSIVDHEDEENDKVGDHDNSGKRQRTNDADTRFHDRHDTEVVCWDRMNDLMRTHEYGSWLSRAS